jgi:hypothetical protein
MTKQTAALRCPCGYGIQCKIQHHGEQLSSVAFFDDEEVSATFGKRVEHCPACEQKIELYRLLSKSRPR